MQNLRNISQHSIMRYPFATLYVILSLPLLIVCKSRALWQFRQMVQCKLPDRNPFLDFRDYGCYCGYGGEGTPVDELDRCCKAHDDCYDAAEHHQSCTSYFDGPYFNFYDFECDEYKIITCLSSNDDCEMFICTCDKVAVDCFSVAPYNDSNYGVPNEICNSAATGLPLCLLLFITPAGFAIKRVWDYIY